MQAPQFNAMIAAIEAQPRIDSGQWLSSQGPCTVTALAIAALPPERQRLVGLFAPDQMCRDVARHYHVPYAAVCRLVEFTDKYATTTPGQTVKEAVLLLLYDLQYGWKARFGDKVEYHLDLYDVYGVDAWFIKAIEEHKWTHYAAVHEAIETKKKEKKAFPHNMFLEVLTTEEVQKSVEQMTAKMKELQDGVSKKFATVAEFAFFSIDSMALSKCVKPIEDFEELYTTKPAQKDLYANFVSMYGSALDYQPTKTIKMVKSKNPNPCAEIPLEIDWNLIFDPKIAEAAETILSLTPAVTATAPPSEAEVDAAITELIESTALVSV